MAEEGYVVDGGTYQLIDGGLYVAVNDTYQAVSEAYVVKNGVYERFYTSEALKGISESFTTSETTDLTLEKFISGSDEVTVSNGAEDLSVTFDSSNCEANLFWSEYELGDQEVWRCQGSSCTPTSGTRVATLSAGTSSYSDPISGGNDYTYSIVPSTNASSSNNATISAGPCG